MKKKGTEKHNGISSGKHHLAIKGGCNDSLHEFLKSRQIARTYAETNFNDEKTMARYRILEKDGVH